MREKATRGGEREKFFSFFSLPAACRLFSRGVVFTRPCVSLALLSLRKNGGLLIVYRHNWSQSTTEELSVYDASPGSVACCQSYLEVQRQFVKLGHITSEPKPVRQKVPQRSILSAVYFSYLWMICLYFIWTTRPLIHMLTTPPCPLGQTGIISLL